MKKILFFAFSFLIFMNAPKAQPLSTFDYSGIKNKVIESYLNLKIKDKNSEKEYTIKTLLNDIILDLGTDVNYSVYIDCSFGILDEIDYSTVDNPYDWLNPIYIQFYSENNISGQFDNSKQIVKYDNRIQTLIDYTPTGLNNDVEYFTNSFSYENNQLLVDVDGLKTKVKNNSDYAKRNGFTNSGWDQINSDRFLNDDTVILYYTNVVTDFKNDNDFILKTDTETKNLGKSLNYKDIQYFNYIKEETPPIDDNQNVDLKETNFLLKAILYLMLIFFVYFVFRFIFKFFGFLLD